MFAFIWSHDSDEFNRLQTFDEIGLCDGGDEQDEYMRWARWINAWGELNGFVRELVDGIFNIRIECLRSLKSLR